jgi:hypothetical protein
LSIEADETPGNQTVMTRSSRPFETFLDRLPLTIVRARLMGVRLAIKVGVSALALMLAGLPVAACVLPGAAMTSAERECCKKMAEQCGDMGMAKSHPCCQPTTTSIDFHALKAPSSSQDHLSLVVLQGLPISIQAITCLSLTPMAFRVSYTHSPPGLESLTTTVLRI